MFILSSKVHLLLCLKHNIHYRDNIVYRDKMSFCYQNYRDIGFFIITQPYLLHVESATQIHHRHR